MKKLTMKLAVVLLALTQFGCVSVARMAGAGKNLLSAATVNEGELKQYCVQMRARDDRTANVAGSKSAYARRIDKLMQNFRDVNGTPLNYKVYITNDINANASIDGSVRVYSGLMDILDDDELRFVLGHEIGHVALGHSLTSMRTAYATAGIKEAVGAMGGVAGALSDSALGSLSAAFVKAQFSQKQELAADEYGMKMMMAYGYNPYAAANSFRKMQKVTGGNPGSFLSSHPSDAKRIETLDKMASGEKAIK